MVAWFRLFSPVYWALFLREGSGYTHWGRLVCSLANIALSFNKESLLFFLEGITKECKSSSAASRYCFCNLLQLLISQNELIMICHVFKIKRHSATFEVRWLLSFFFHKKGCTMEFKSFSVFLQTLFLWVFTYANQGPCLVGMKWFEWKQKNNCCSCVMDI